MVPDILPSQLEILSVGQTYFKTNLSTPVKQSQHCVAQAAREKWEEEERKKKERKERKKKRKMVTSVD